MRGHFLFKFIIVFAVFAGLHAQAQTPKASSSTDNKASKVLGSQLTTILEYGLAGGVLGLSTLSFYGRPQEKLSHIPVGMALGIIVGAVYSTSQMVSQPLAPNALLESPQPEPLPSLAFQWTFDF